MGSKWPLALVEVQSLPGSLLVRAEEERTGTHCDLPIEEAGVERPGRESNRRNVVSENIKESLYIYVSLILFSQYSSIAAFHILLLLLLFSSKYQC